MLGFRLAAPRFARELRQAAEKSRSQSAQAFIRVAAPLLLAICLLGALIGPVALLGGTVAMIHDPTGARRGLVQWSILLAAFGISGVSLVLAGRVLVMRARQRILDLEALSFGAGHAVVLAIVVLVGLGG